MGIGTLLVHIVRDKQRDGVTAHEGGHGINGRAAGRLPDLAHQGLDKQPHKFHQSVACQKGQKDGAHRDQKAQRTAQPKQEWKQAGAFQPLSRADFGNEHHGTEFAHNFKNGKNNAGAVLIPVLFQERHQRSGNAHCHNDPLLCIAHQLADNAAQRIQGDGVSALEGYRHKKHKDTDKVAQDKLYPS
ncbi:hypothetical protein SDC9_135249 [bioreactor metagenome]|uniref:Uncharacterized protein n=1 Tax=bioreactor metagenome TaxID=1076179 RepID=A0A645DGI1_9ZZZZ